MSLNPISINGFGVDLGEFTTPNNRFNQFVQNILDNFYDIADTVISGDVVWDTANNTEDYTAVVYIPDIPLVTPETETITTYSKNEAIELLDKTFGKLIDYASTQHEINDTIKLTKEEVNELKHELYVFVGNNAECLQFVDFV